MNRVLQPRPLVVLGLNVGMGTAAVTAISGRLVMTRFGEGPPLRILVISG